MISVIPNDRLYPRFAHPTRGHTARDTAEILPNRPADHNTVHAGLSTERQSPGTNPLDMAHRDRKLLSVPYTHNAVDLFTPQLAPLVVLSIFWIWICQPDQRVIDELLHLVGIADPLAGPPC